VYDVITLQNRDQGSVDTRIPGTSRHSTCFPLADHDFLEGYKNRTPRSLPAETQVIAYVNPATDFSPDVFQDRNHMSSSPGEQVRENTTRCPDALLRSASQFLRTAFHVHKIQVAVRLARVPTQTRRLGGFACFFVY